MTIRGVVVEGKRLGRKLGFPTANIVVSEGVDIENGVYRSYTHVNGRRYPSITNIGHNPTTGYESRRAESYIFNFEGDIYGKAISVDLLEQIRKEQKFDSVEALREQVKRDIELVKAHL